jgi:transposase
MPIFDSGGHSGEVCLPDIVEPSRVEVVGVRGEQEPQVSMLAFIDLETRIPQDHPLRTIRLFADEALAALSPTFDAMYAVDGRPSIPPERLLKASLLISLYSIRSERAFCEQLEYNELFRWFLGMNLVEPSFDSSTFSKNRQRLLEHNVAQQFFDQIVMAADRLGLLSDEHFTVDGTLIEAAASLKSFRPKDQPPSDQPPDDPGNPTVNFHGQKRSNATHQSTTDPQARLFRKGKGKEAKLAFVGHVFMENRNGMAIDFTVNEATGTAERDAAVDQVDEAKQRGFRPKTVGGDKNYDTKKFVGDMRERDVTPHVAQNTSGRRSAIDGRTTRHAGYAVSQRVRKRVEEIFGWMKTVGGFRRTRFRGLERTKLAGYLVAAAYNLVRIARLSTAAAAN